MDCVVGLPRELLKFRAVARLALALSYGSVRVLVTHFNTAGPWFDPAT